VNELYNFELYNFDAYDIPQWIAESLEAWGRRARPTGGFLRAVLENDLFAAYGRADPTSRAAMHEIVKAIYNQMPTGSHGSRRIVQTWTGTD